jgi:hypothetical protein
MLAWVNFIQLGSSVVYLLYWAFGGSFECEGPRGGNLFSALIDTYAILTKAAMRAAFCSF